MGFHDFTGIDSSALGDGRSQGVPVSIRSPHGERVARTFSGRTSCERRLEYICIPSRMFGGGNQISIFPWPNSCPTRARLAPFIVREAGEDYTCMDGTASSMIRLFGQSKWTHDR